MIRTRDGMVNAATVALRRRQVAQLRARLLTLDEIHGAMADMAARGRNVAAVVNPGTGAPWSRSQIAKDLRWVEAQWEEDAREAGARYRGRILAELEEVKRRAWSKDNLRLVILANEKIAALLGLNAPHRLAHEGPDGGPVAFSGGVEVVATDYRDAIGVLAPRELVLPTDPDTDPD